MDSGGFLSRALHSVVLVACGHIVGVFAGSPETSQFTKIPKKFLGHFCFPRLMSFEVEFCLSSSREGGLVVVVVASHEFALWSLRSCLDLARTGRRDAVWLYCDCIEISPLCNKPTRTPLYPSTPRSERNFRVTDLSTSFIVNKAGSQSPKDRHFHAV